MADGSASFLVRTYVPADQAGIIRLWEHCGLVSPSNDPKRDIDLKLSFQPGLLFVAESDGRIIASVMAGYEGHRGWINYLAVAPEHRREGLGRRMMGMAEDALRKLGCPKVNLQVRADNQAVVEFYERIGFAVEKRFSLGKRLDSGH
ncbi:MAG: GNAT family acetyltransferase [Candidatus Binatia bacterium]|nr:GNAT family acetyltransferase [Candidatus Binatia bacterium]